jgi:5-methylcytosine-specific restriction endonuclease McrA
VIQRLAKPRPSRLNKRAIAATKARQWQELRQRVHKRDAGRCRVCGKAGYEAHHVEFRSRGGKDEMANLVLVCRQCHQDIHGHVVKLAGNAQTKRGLRIGRWDDDANDHVWEAA